MPRRHCALKAFAWAIVLTGPVTASAQTTTMTFSGAATIAVGSPPPLVSKPMAGASDAGPLTSGRVSFTDNPRVWKSLRFAFVGLQTLDIHSTFLALGDGKESNAVMRPFMSSPPLAVAIKAGVTYLIYRASEGAAQRHDKRMFWLLVASDAALSVIAIHNYAVAR